MTDEIAPMLRSAKGKRPSFYETPGLDQMMSMIMVLADHGDMLGERGLSVSWHQKHEGQAVHASCVIAHRFGHLHIRSLEPGQ